MRPILSKLGFRSLSVPNYANTPVAEIRYHLGGKMLTATEVLQANAVKHGQVYTRYANGFEIWADSHCLPVHLYTAKHYEQYMAGEVSTCFRK